MSWTARSPVVVGRKTELAGLLHDLAEARAGHGSVVLIEGEAGVGKSRLVSELTRHGETAGMPVLAGRAVLGGGPFRAFAQALSTHLRRAQVLETEEMRPFRPALARLLPQWGTGAAGRRETGSVDRSSEDGAAPTPSGEPAAADPVVLLGEGVLRLLEAIGAETGCLLVLEDVHWADLDTMVLLEYLVTAVAGARILLVVSARTDERSPELLDRLRADRDVRRVTLSRLRPEDVQRLAAACTGGSPLPDDALAFLVEASEGLPLLVEELLTGLVESGSLTPEVGGWQVRDTLAPAVPRTLVELVRRRLDGWPAHYRAVLDAAAVIGRDVVWTVLAPTTGLSEADVVAALRAAVTASMVAADPDRDGAFRWRHALVRDAVLAEMLAPQRMVVAARAAEALEQADPTLHGPDAALIADLYLQAGHDDTAADRFVVLARRAVSRGGLRTADDLLLRAAALGAAAAAVERVRVLALMGTAADALRIGEEALRATAGEPRVKLCVNLARAAVTVGEWRAALDYVDRAESPDDPEIQAVAADALYGSGDIAVAERLAEAAAAAAEAVGRWDIACEALEVVGRCLRIGAAPAAARVFRRAADIAEANGLVPWRVRALFGLATVTHLAGDASALLLEARELALDVGMLAEVAGIDLIIADTISTRDGPLAALPIAEGAAATAAQARLPQLQAMTLTLVAMAHAESGDTAQLAATLERAVELAPTSPDVAALTCFVRAMPPLFDRDLVRAAALLDEGVAILRAHASAAPLPYWGLWALVRTVVAADELVSGTAPVSDRNALLELRESPLLVRPHVRGALAYAEAVAAGRAGDGVSAVAHLADGDALLVDTPWWRRLLRLLVLEAALAAGWGDPVPQLRAELAAFHAAGDQRSARRCRDLLRVAGAPVPRRRDGGDVPLQLRALGITSREYDVLTLVRRRMGNAEIAQRLFLSPRTVETHVARLLAKTGASSRAEL